MQLFGERNTRNEKWKSGTNVSGQNIVSEGTIGSTSYHTFLLKALGTSSSVFDGDEDPFNNKKKNLNQSFKYSKCFR